MKRMTQLLLGELGKELVNVKSSLLIDFIEDYKNSGEKITHIEKQIKRLEDVQAAFDAALEAVCKEGL